MGARTELVVAAGYRGAVWQFKRAVPKGVFERIA
jgi:hypothetical protein